MVQDIETKAYQKFSRGGITHGRTEKLSIHEHREQNISKF